jgi:hypothetical protein
MYSKKNSFRKLLQKFEGDPTVGSTVIALSNRYSGLERRDLGLIEQRFHFYYKENGFRKLL